MLSPDTALTYRNKALDALKKIRRENIEENKKPTPNPIYSRYIFEQYSRVNDTIYFGSYGSGATCISGLLKIQPHFKSIVEKGPKVSDYVKIKERRSRAWPRQASLNRLKRIPLYRWLRNLMA